MKELIAVLQVGIVLTTPIFFLATLLVLWRVLRATEATLAVLVYVKHHLDLRHPATPDSEIHTTAQLRDAEEKFYPGTHGEHPDAGDRG
ncbi:MAG TPA: hypothetical protein VNE39_03545 [Planctomycetota bacterium]|nr:hypothetical protein [Planctomycetota bacterium]